MHNRNNDNFILVVPVQQAVRELRQQKADFLHLISPNLARVSRKTSSAGRPVIFPITSTGFLQPQVFTFRCIEFIQAADQVSKQYRPFLQRQLTGQLFALFQIGAHGGSSLKNRVDVEGNEPVAEISATV